MKAINLNAKCDYCSHETNECVKMSARNGLDICFDTNEFENLKVNEKLLKELAETKYERNKWRMNLIIMWISVILAFVAMAFLK